MARLTIFMVRSSVVNVVATACLNQELDLCKLGKFKEVFHDSDVYGGRVAYFKTSSMKGRVSIFSSGKMISAGTRSELKAFHELKFAMKFLVENGFIRKVKLQPKVQNIVVVADFARSINLEKLAEKIMGIYEPEQFPGMILRTNRPYQASFLVFSSGKVVVTGLKSSGQIAPVLQRLETIVNLGA
jgi:transcription initiation factor TFIID TATA-box-binding protein